MANLAFFYTLSQFNQNQIDSLLLAFNSDSIVNQSLALITGHWHLDSEHIHQRLCSFIEIDSVNYGGRWGENRVIDTKGKELGARLALAKLGYPYHLDYLEGIIKEQDFSNHKMARMLTGYASYLANDQILNALFDVALTDIYYDYIDYDNHTFEQEQYYFLTFLLFRLHESLTLKDNLPLKELHEASWEDYQSHRVWVEQNRHRKGLLKDHRYGLNKIGHSGLTHLRPLQSAKKNSREFVNGASQLLDISPNRPHIRHQGICYFNGDTIQVNRLDSGNKIRLMAYKDARQLMGSALEWQGVDEIEPYHYGVLSATTKEEKSAYRKVSAVCRKCGENGTDLTVSVIIQSGS